METSTIILVVALLLMLAVLLVLSSSKDNSLIQELTRAESHFDLLILIEELKEQDLEAMKSFLDPTHSDYLELKLRVEILNQLYEAIRAKFTRNLDSP